MIRLRGVRQNNLKRFDLDLPLHRLIVVTGLSGSGKSSLAFDTIFAEGQRRYIETFSPYARQFFDRMDKPQVDAIEGIPPAIAIEQRNAVKTTRSTVGTMTEICDYMKLLWPHVSQLHCRQCGQPVRKDPPQRIWETLLDREPAIRNTDLLIVFELPLTEKLSLTESLSLITRQGYQRLLLPAASARPAAALELNEAQVPWGGLESPGGERTATASELAGVRSGDRPDSKPLTKAPGRETEWEIVRIEEAADRLKELKPASLTVVQDRLKLAPAGRARFVEACEQAYHFGKGKLTVHVCDSKSAFTLQPLNTSPRQPSNPPTVGASSFKFSNRYHCADCDIEYREPSSALFSFNHPLGACPTCRGFGRIIGIDYHLVLPDPSKTMAGGVVRPWQSGVSAECQEDLMKFCRIRKAPVDVPFEQLPIKWRDWLIEGDPDYGKDAAHQWPRAWYGVKGYFRWLESKSYKMHVRVLLSRYRSYTPCPDCRGKRFQPEALLYRCPVAATAGSPLPSGGDPRPSLETVATSPPVSGMTLADFYQLPIRDAVRVIDGIVSRHPAKPSNPIGLVLGEVRSRLGYLDDVGLGYLTLDRPMRTLSGGETERVNLTTCLGTRLVNTLYILDEPSVGLHPRDTGRLIKILEQLRDLGNTVVVVEHEASVIRAADRIVDLGPGHGEAGGHVVFEGSYPQILRSVSSLTGQYLSGRKQIPVPQRRSVLAQIDGRGSTPDTHRDTRNTKQGTRSDFPALVPTNSWLTLRNASLHNLKNLTVEVPLGRFVCVTGVSGSGKTTLVRELLLPALEARLKSRGPDSRPTAQASDRVEDPTADGTGNGNEDPSDSPSSTDASSSASLAGWEHLGRAILVDQSPLGKTPRSNPAVYIGAFDDIRDVFARTDAAKQRGLNASAFSFNSTQGQCERCRGAGFEKIEMQFLSDIFIRCPDCAGRRYRPHILDVKISRPSPAVGSQNRGRNKATGRGLRTTDKSWSIADLLDATVDQGIDFLVALSESAPARRAVEKLELLREVGLGYLRLGQPINTLSGGESQRLKLVSHLAESLKDPPNVLSSTCETIVPSLSSRAGVSPAPSQPAGKIRPLSPTAGSRTTADGPLGCPALFLFDEPTTGLHFDDVRVLLKVFQRLVDAGHSVLVIEHNLDVIKCADWIIDLGPEAGDQGGQIVAQGTPEQIAACDASHTGRFLRDLGPTPPGPPDVAASRRQAKQVNPCPPKPQPPPSP